MRRIWSSDHLLRVGPGMRDSSGDGFVAPPRPTGFRSTLCFVYRHGLPPNQRVASLLFLIQSAVSLTAIGVFCFVQSAGVAIHVFQMPLVAHVFDDVYRIDPSNTLAKARFENLFLPLVLIYAISLPGFAASIIRDLPLILRDLRSHLRLLVPLIFFLFCLWLELFVRVPTRHKDLQQTIIDGGATGYVILFVVLPMAFGIIAAGLPLPRGRSQNLKNRSRDRRFGRPYRLDVRRVLRRHRHVVATVRLQSSRCIFDRRSNRVTWTADLCKDETRQGSIKHE